MHAHLQTRMHSAPQSFQHFTLWLAVYDLSEDWSFADG